MSSKNALKDQKKTVICEQPLLTLPKDEQKLHVTCSVEFSLFAYLAGRKTILICLSQTNVRREPKHEEVTQCHGRSFVFRVYSPLSPIHP